MDEIDNKAQFMKEFGITDMRTFTGVDFTNLWSALTSLKVDPEVAKAFISKIPDCLNFFSGYMKNAFDSFNNNVEMDIKVQQENDELYIDQMKFIKSFIENSENLSVEERKVYLNLYEETLQAKIEYDNSESEKRDDKFNNFNQKMLSMVGIVITILSSYAFCKGKRKLPKHVPKV